MTKHRSSKRRIREQMAADGSTYTEARTAVLRTSAPAASAPAWQLERYVELGFPKLAGMTTPEFRAWLEPLVSTEIEPEALPDDGRIPALVVIRQQIVSAAEAMATLEVRGKAGYVDMDPSDPSTFLELESVSTPDADAYVVHDFDPGDAYRNQPPSAVMPQLLDAGRAPITIDEAICAAVLHPKLVSRKHAFSILASRSSAPKVGQSVPALWISRGAPRLGWCWDNNPHTWLGSASCSGRWAPE